MEGAKLGTCDLADLEESALPAFALVLVSSTSALLAFAPVLVYPNSCSCLGWRFLFRFFLRRLCNSSLCNDHDK